ncbi:MAG: hypothetical protein COB20_15320 [SAR86 cluster bacterium]|uniref:Uncharacterized protein n=1 Tax=SAR86 cluster bacterium TaxID=2030880 RepID=A0A2A4WV61_9GAMM|nr:MAG: hypothetical protein COB20_15320 [SAR86 cluster bacterium]
MPKTLNKCTNSDRQTFESLGFASTVGSNGRSLTGNDFEFIISPLTNSMSKINEVRLQLILESIEEVTPGFGASSRLPISTNEFAIWSF